MNKFILSGFLFFITSGCSSFVDKVHQQIAAEEGGSSASTNLYPSQAYGKLKTKLKDKMPIKDPISYALGADDFDKGVEQTPLKVRKRFSVADFVDSDTTGSLWSSYDDSSSLFATSNARKSGEIVQIDVMETMKNTISKELRKAYPLANIFTPEVAAEEKKEEAKREPASATGDNSAKPKEDTEVADIVYDKITARVSNEIDKDHIILKGRKEVYFRNMKRLIEINGLAKKSDIDATDRIKSDQLLESKIFILQ